MRRAFQSAATRVNRVATCVVLGEANAASRGASDGECRELSRVNLAESCDGRSIDSFCDAARFCSSGATTSRVRSGVTSVFPRVMTRRSQNLDLRGEILTFSLRCDVYVSCALFPALNLTLLCL